MHVGIPVIHCLVGLSALHAIPLFYTHCTVSDHERGIPPCQLLNVFQTALRKVVVNSHKVERGCFAWPDSVMSHRLTYLYRIAWNMENMKVWVLKQIFWGKLLLLRLLKCSLFITDKILCSLSLYMYKLLQPQTFPLYLFNESLSSLTQHFML